jgi:hypothetical protein
MQDVIDPLPLAANAKYDLSANDMVFYLNHNRALEFYNGGEMVRHIDCPLYQITIEELIKIREEVKRAGTTGKLYASCISDGGEARGRGLFFIATKGTVINYK